MKKKLVCLLLVGAMLLLSGCGGISLPWEKPAETTDPAPSQEPVANQHPASVEGPGFDSPEAAILAYAQALQAGDVQGILASFAIETYVDNYDMTAHLEVNSTYTVSMQQPIPSSDAYTRALNLMARQSYITKNLTYMYLTLGKVENFVQPITFSGNPYEKPSELVDDMVIYNWMDMLAKMEIGQVLRMEDLGLDSDNAAPALERQKNYLNCDELIPLAVELTIDGEAYYLCVDVACYDGRWYNGNLFGTIAAYLSADALGGGLYPLEE